MAQRRGLLNSVASASLFVSAVLLLHAFRWASSQLLTTAWLSAFEPQWGKDVWDGPEGLLTEAGGAYASDLWHRLSDPTQAALLASWPLLMIVISGGVVPTWWTFRALGARSAASHCARQLGRLWVLGWGLLAVRGGLMALSIAFGAGIHSVLLACDDPRWATWGLAVVALVGGLGMVLASTSGDIAFAAVVDRDCPALPAAELGLSACLRRPLRLCSLSCSLTGLALALGALMLASPPSVVHGTGPSLAGRLLAGHLLYCAARTAWLAVALRVSRQQWPPYSSSASGPAPQRPQKPLTQAQAR